MIGTYDGATGLRNIMPILCLVSEIGKRDQSKHIPKQRIPCTLPQSTCPSFAVFAQNLFSTLDIVQLCANGRIVNPDRHTVFGQVAPDVRPLRIASFHRLPRVLHLLPLLVRRLLSPHPVHHEPADWRESHRDLFPLPVGEAVPVGGELVRRVTL